MTCGQASASDEVMAWNQMMQDVTRAQVGDDAGPGPTARSSAILHAAIFDAVNSIDRTHNPAMVMLDPIPGASKRAAAASAGYHALSALYGSDASLQAQFDSLYQAQIAALPAGPSRDSGVTLGQMATSTIMSARAGDGYNTVAPYTEGTGPGEWRSNYQPFVPAWGPQWGNVTPWVLNSGDQFQPGPPPALDSAEYTAAWQEVYEKGAAVGSTRTADETEIAWFWGNDRDGTYKPPGHMNRITQIVAEQQFAGMDADTRVSESARLFALTNVGMLEASIAAWDSKFNTDLDFWRPIAGIHEADTDGNPNTFVDTSWEPLSHVGFGGDPFTPPFPAYVSGHATFAAVHAALMAEFFGTDDISFWLDTDDVDALGAIRNFDSFSEAAWENAISRVFLGVHWRFDAEAGYNLGYDVGAFVAANFLTLIPAPGFGGLVLALGAMGAVRRRR